MKDEEGASITSFLTSATMGFAGLFALFGENSKILLTSISKNIAKGLLSLAQKFGLTATAATTASGALSAFAATGLGSVAAVLGPVILGIAALVAVT
jgi:hypothetical protein